MSLAEARDLARDARRLLLQGIDPIEDRRARRQAVRLGDAKTVTFRNAAARYIASHEAAWRNEKHRRRWTRTSRPAHIPCSAISPVTAIDTALVMQVLDPIWRTKPETAGRVRGRIEAILSWATVRGYRAGENPAQWRGHLDQLLPARGKVRRVRHHAAMDWRDVSSRTTMPSPNPSSGPPIPP